jgi:DNA-binding NtrC family response regulator
MKANALLISKEASDSNATIAEAAARAGLSLLQAPDAKRAFELLRSGLAEIDLVIIDVDPGIHSMAILEAIAARDTSPPVIVVTGFEQFEMAPIARRHGAAACIAKPFTASELVARIEEVCPVDYASSSCNCDAWGHPFARHHKNSAECSGHCNGYTSGHPPSLQTRQPAFVMGR